MNRARSSGQIVREDFSEAFVAGMKQAVITRGSVEGRISDSNSMSFLHAARTCLDRYIDTKNPEYLFMAANYIMFEYMSPRWKKLCQVP